MKRIKIGFIGLSMLALTVVAFQNTGSVATKDLKISDLLSLNGAQAEINPYCPNGCLTTSGWCYCYSQYDLEPGKW